MLPKQERLTKEDFKGIRPKVFFRSTLFDIAVIPQTVHMGKFACVIAKKTEKKAVDRNLIKRRIMESVALHKGNISQSVIIYPKKNILSVPFSQINDEIKKAFDTLH